MVAHNYSLRYLSRSQDRLANTSRRNRWEDDRRARVEQQTNDKRASAGRMIDMLRGTGANVDAFSGAQTPEEVNYLAKMMQAAQEKERTYADEAFSAGDLGPGIEYNKKYGQGRPYPKWKTKQGNLNLDKALLEAKQTGNKMMEAEANSIVLSDDTLKDMGLGYLAGLGYTRGKIDSGSYPKKKSKAGAIKQGIDPKTGKPAFYARDSNGELKKLKGALPPKKKEASRVSKALRLYKAMFDDGYGGRSPDAPKFEKWIKSEDYATILRSIRQGPVGASQNQPPAGADQSLVKQEAKDYGASESPEGTEYENKTTGEIIITKNGRWVPK